MDFQLAAIFKTYLHWGWGVPPHFLRSLPSPRSIQKNSTRFVWCSFEGSSLLFSRSRHTCLQTFCVIFIRTVANSWIIMFWLLLMYIYIHNITIYIYIYNHILTVLNTYLKYIQRLCTPTERLRSSHASKVKWPLVWMSAALKMPRRRTSKGLLTSKIQGGNWIVYSISYTGFIYFVYLSTYIVYIYIHVYIAGRSI